MPPPLLMGILNVTPDSFSDGGRFRGLEAALDHARLMKEEGADVIDVGGESTRPGAEAVAVEEELARVLPVVERLAIEGLGPVSIDTRKARVMREAAAMGAAMLNDVSALTHDPESLSTAARLGLPVVLMHSLGEPATMQRNPQYEDVIAEVTAALRARRDAAEAAGIPRERIWLDPGIGFGKTRDHNLALLRNLGALKALGCKVLLGASRKRFIAALDRDVPPEARLGGSVAVSIWGARAGADMLRVHDVGATRQALAVWGAIAG
ncbi:MAG: dihydropteroate synthase [Alphaproteobacteria bacterium]|nr:dihydropteroate synthase [Alphaproteobacteria bacterium]